MSAEETPKTRSQHYRERAKEMRDHAARSSLPEIKRQYLELAEQYDYVAREAEKRETSKGPGE
jgi:hypothetical protein